MDITQLKQLVAHMHAGRDARLAVWRELRSGIIPHRGIFPGDTGDGRAKLVEVLDTFTNAPLRSLRRGAAGLTSAMTPVGLPWFRLEYALDEITELPGARQWLDDVEQEVGTALATSGFYQEIHAANEEFLGYGCFLLYCGMEERQDAEGAWLQEVVCENCPVGTFAVALDAHKRLEAVARTLTFTAKELEKRYGKEALADKTKQLLETAPYTPRDVVHVVERRTQRDATRLDNRNMPFASYFYEPSGTKLLKESGYREMPYFYTVWTRGANVYGTGPGDAALGEFKSLNAMERAVLVGLNKSIDPPMRAPGHFRKRLQTDPGAVNAVSGVEPGGIAPLYELNFLPGIAAVQQKIQVAEQRIDELLMGSIFGDPMLDQAAKGVTASAIMLKRQMIAQLMGPSVSAYATMVLNPLILRIKSLLDEAHMLPPLPGVLAKLGKLPRALLRINMISPMAQSMRQDTADTTRAIVGDVTAMAGIRPEVLDKIDLDQAVDELAKGLSVPGRVVRSDVEVEQIRKERAAQEAAMQQQQQAMAMTAMAMKAGGISTNGTVAGEMLGAAGGKGNAP